MKKLIFLLSIIFLFSCEKETVKYLLTTSSLPADTGTVIPETREYNDGDTANLIAVPAEGYEFDKWTGATGLKETTIVMDGAKTVVGNFKRIQYALTDSVEGQGTITQKIIKAGAATNYNSGTVVELTAVPSVGWKFKEWKGGLLGTTNPQQITMDKVKTVSAVFEEIPPFYLDANGVTIKARDWVTVGTTGQVGGVTYTAVDNTTLKSMADNNEDVTKVVTTLVTNMRELFANKATFNQDIGSWDVSSVTNMYGVFYFAKGFNQDIGSWDVSNVTYTVDMFSYASAFNQNIGSWNTAAVTDMRQMFSGASAFNGNIGSWNTAAVTDMDSMFNNAPAFNQDIGSWDVSSVTNMRNMFANSAVTSGINSTFNQDIGSWDVSSVTYEGFRSMFRQAVAFNQDIGAWDVSNASDMQGMFLSAKAFNQDIGSWDVSKVTDMSQMFYNATAFNQDLTKWCVSNISRLTEPSGFNTSSALTEANKPVWGICDATNLVAWYPFNNNANDFSGNDNNGTVNGAILTKDRFGFENSAYDFDGNDDYIEFQEIWLNQSENFTISAWVMLKSTEGYGGDASPILTQTKNGEFSLSLQGVTNDRDNIHWSLQVKKQSEWHRLKQDYTVNQWTHLVLIYSDTKMIAYQNGEKTGELEIPSGNRVNHIHNPHIGGLNDSNNKINAKIDDIAIWDRILNETEIKAMYIK